MEKRLIGHVPVDCAMLVICDPINYGVEPPNRGDVQGVEFWGKGEEIVREELQRRGYRVTVKNGTYRIETTDKAEADRLKEIIKQIAQEKETFIMTDIREDSAYWRICDAAYNENLGGPVDGLDGVLAISTMGDGYFPVYGYYDEYGLVKIEIEIMAPDE
ncbi:hypothetical protein JIR001_25950 [Polycladomyces abyssicola]|uniref:Uncharacterized protein n=1 Tax=Polycladomyces abyssicola TaxID=1125966 RepID=A0A8D5UG82_9BACL|nr:hypothetical protein [Polycladomyces abyssicola]BCU82812.1 hypothetical protein JIR001_25950 [Polycladomyces abyssicola]